MAETWIVVADGGGARIFEEHHRLGPLSERRDLMLESREDRGQTPSHRRGGDGDPADRAERRFLSLVAAVLDAGEASKAFQNLVVVAPPRALGVLRSGLSLATARRIELCDPHDARVLDVDALEARLRRLRAEA